MRPTPSTAWNGGTAALVALLGAAVVLGRPDLLVLAAPLGVWVVWAWLHRPQTDVALTTSPERRVSITEGDRLDVAIGTDAAQPMLVTVAWPDVEGADFDPAYACRCAVVRPGQGNVVGIQPHRWGSLDLGPARVVVGDPTGAWQLTRPSTVVRATVQPVAATLAGATGVAHPLGISGVHQSARPGDGVALAGIRDFRPGDRLRRINWRVTSRTRSLAVNETLTDRDTDVLVVADSSLDASGPLITGPTPLDVTARAVVAITRYYVGLGDRVRVSDVGSKLREVPAGSGVRQARIVSEMFSRAPRGGGSAEIRRRVGSLVPGTLVFVCSPLLIPDVVEEIGRLRRLGGEVVVVDTLPPEMGEHALDHRRVDSVSAEAWHLRWQERAGVLDGLRLAGVPVTPWRGPTSLGAVLQAMEAARTAPRRRLG